MVKLESVELESHLSSNNETNTSAGTSHEENITNFAKIVSHYYDNLCYFYSKKCQKMQKYNITFYSYFSFHLPFLSIYLLDCASQKETKQWN